MPKPKFRFPQMDHIYEVIPDKYKEVFEWMYETTKVAELGIVLIGSMTATAVANPNITFWEAMAEAKDHFEKNLQVDVVKVGEDKVETVH